MEYEVMVEIYALSSYNLGQLYDEQRMPSEQEEIIVAAHRAHPQHLGKPLFNQRLQLLAVVHHGYVPPVVTQLPCADDELTPRLSVDPRSTIRQALPTCLSRECTQGLSKEHTLEQRAFGLLIEGRAHRTYAMT